MRDKTLLLQLQCLPLRAKCLMSQQRIREWYNHFNGDVCVSFSGGKDSTVLAHLVHDLYPEVPLVFCNTGLEYPEIQQFARKMGAVFTRPKMSFSEVISKYGYPLISKETSEAIQYARLIRKDDRGGVQHNLSEESRANGTETSKYRGGGRTGEGFAYWVKAIFRKRNHPCSTSKSGTRFAQKRSFSSAISVAI